MCSESCRVFRVARRPKVDCVGCCVAMPRRSAVAIREPIYNPEAVPGSMHYVPRESWRRRRRGAPPPAPAAACPPIQFLKVILLTLHWLIFNLSFFCLFFFTSSIMASSQVWCASASACRSASSDKQIVGYLKQILA